VSSKIYFATTNEGKRREAAQILAPLGIEVELVPISVAVPETGSTFDENAIEKAQAYARKLRRSVVADDSGIEIDALHGLPGVDSASFSALGIDWARGEIVERRIPKLRGFELDEANNDRLLEAMKGRSNRAGRYVCVLALAGPDGELLHLCRGETELVVGEESRGSHGFGYDRVVHPPGDTRTFAELEPSEKNAISHRTQAWIKLIQKMGGGKDGLR